MRKTPADAPQGDTPADGASPSPDTPVSDDAAATSGEQQLDPQHEWPSEGGCYVRQADGSLTRED